MSAVVEKQFMIGLPGAGKSTFLAALWHVVFTGDVEGSVEFSKLNGDKSYLNRIRDEWADASELERTKIGMEQTISVSLKHPTRDVVTELVVPDLSGESFEQQWTHRTAAEEYVSDVRVSKGGLLLIHPHVRDETLISEASAIVEALGEDNDDGTKSVPIRWDASQAPTQLQLVDLLQFVQHIVGTRRLRLSVVVSAWDLVEEATPEEFLERRLPLLHQFLASNSQSLEQRFYGISAQGGDLKKEQAALQKISEPSERIRVVAAGAATTHDISLPIRWIMGWE